MNHIKVILAAFGTLLLTGLASAQSLVLEGTLSLPGRTAVEASGNYAYVGGNNNFAVVEVSRPGSPVLRGQLTPNVPEVNAISLANGYAFLAGGAGGMVVVNVTTPNTPTWTGALSLTASCLGVSARDTLVAIATQTQVVLAGVRNPAQPRILASYNVAARWIEFDGNPTLLHVGTTGGVKRLEIVTAITGRDTTFQLRLDDEYGSSVFTSVESAPPYLNAANQATLTAIHLDNYTFAGQYGVPAAIRAIAGGSGFSFIALASGPVFYLDQRQSTPQFVAAVTVSGSPTGLALTQAASQRLVIVSHSVGVSVLSYTPLSSSERPASVVPQRLSLAAYPNPFNSIVELRIEIVRPGLYTLRVFDVLGRTIENRSLHLSETTAVERVNLSDHSAGIYIARVIGPNEDASAKLIYLP
ncbi:T9SS type A sorting domain-containing protein [bacterium]|nr:T9SS type A sorting domain-containing protein [bacterium]MBU1982854.1 T9SS type A sorting domain-containing protein [bacterium]